MRHVNRIQPSSSWPSCRQGAQLRAFTIVELLVVVSIIVLLIAMLLPALGAARTHTREMICKSNMKQIVTANLAYAGDNDEAIPANRFMPWPGQNYHVTWRWLITKNGYIDAGKVWNCPAPEAPLPLAEDYGIHGSIDCVDDPANPSGPPGDVRANYAYNGRMFWRYSPNGSPDNPAGTSMTRKKEALVSQILKPSNTFMVLETKAAYPDLGEWTVNWIDADGTGPNGWWHRWRGMWAICDGHVEHLGLLETGSPDCRWHDPGPADDANYPGSHSHPDWEAICAPVYKKNLSGY